MKQMQDRQKAEKPYGRITTEQYYSLTPMGKELHDYWMKFKPKMYEEMYQNGTLWKILKSEDSRLDEMVIELMQNGLDEPGAKEVARSEIYYGTEETAEDDEEETEQDRLNREMWEAYTETMDYLQNLRQNPKEH